MWQLRDSIVSLGRQLNPLIFALRLAPLHGRLLMLALAAIVTAVLLTLISAGFKTLEERLGAQGWVLTGDDTPEERINIVAIDEKSLAEVGPWPWSRDVMARLVRVLDEAGVQLQLLDIVYPEVRPGDDAFIAALQSAHGAVLAQVPVLQSDQQVKTGAMTHPLSGVSCSAGGSDSLSTASSYIASHSGFATIPKGHITPLVANDGSVRHVPAFICVDNQAYPALAISALLQAVNAPAWNVTVTSNERWMGPARTLRLNAYPGLNIPLDADGNLRVSYQNLPQTYRAISAVDVMNGNIEPGLLAGSWVLVGATAFGMDDIVPTPYNGATPGVEIQARLLSSLLDDAIPYTPAAANWLLALLALLSGAVLLWLASARERLSAYGLPIATVLLPLLALGLHWQLLSSMQIWLGWVVPAVYAVAAASLLMLLEQSRVRDQRSRIYGNLNSYLPSDVAREIAYSLPNSSINARRSDFTLLSADLRNFSAFGEARPPEESAALLHFFFVRATEIVERHHGHIHEFKGDSLLAVWDGQSSKSAQQALDAAHEMLHSIQRDMPQNPPSGLEPLALGIGIEQGPALIGSIGPAHRRSLTLLGDTVTITLRIQEMTAELAQPILLGECVSRQLGAVALESQGSYLLNGLRIPHTLFAPLSAEALQRRGRSEQVNLKVISGGRSGH
jgi:adenylate cyclase